MSLVQVKGASLEVLSVSKRFGDLKALDNVSMRVKAGSFHALLGENGAGKSTLVKCLVGYNRADDGQIMVDDRERTIANPHDAHALGIGMVYQHFTLIPSMTGIENLVMARADVPAVISWPKERARIDTFMQSVPFRIPLDRPVQQLAAGEKQKLEILKQLYLERRFMILDEPTSVLTPEEADQVLGLLKRMTEAGTLSVLMITHKFREVRAFADAVTVLRKGKLAGAGQVADLSVAQMAEMMVGGGAPPTADIQTRRVFTDSSISLQIEALCVDDDAGLPCVRDLSLTVQSGEIVGIAGVSGNGQRQLVEALIGQRAKSSGQILVAGQPFQATRKQMRARGVFALPEEPLRNACVANMSVADNMALRTFDRFPLARGLWLRPRAKRAQARQWIETFKIKTPGPLAPISQLSGGNVQRVVLARELSEKVSLLIVANPVFGLDFGAVKEIHERIVAARNGGTAVLLISEDLDELIELSDRILVMSEGQLVYETKARDADPRTIGRYMAGQHSATESNHADH